MLKTLPMDKSVTPSDVGKALNALRNAKLSAEKRQAIGKAAVTKRWEYHREAIAEQTAALAHHRKGMRSGAKKKK